MLVEQHGRMSFCMHCQHQVPDKSGGEPSCGKTKDGSPAPVLFTLNRDGKSFEKCSQRSPTLVQSGRELWGAIDRLFHFP